MRNDLDFLYQKAMRSKDLNFINEVIGVISQDDGSTLWFDELTDLMERAEFFHNLKFDVDDFVLDRFSIIIDDSQRGADWYRNR